MQDGKLVTTNSAYLQAQVMFYKKLERQLNEWSRVDYFEPI